MELAMPTEIYMYIFNKLSLTLSNIINLMAVTKDLRRILSLEEYWHVISDTKTILYKFIRQIFKSDTSYPYHKIQKMCVVDPYDIFHCPNLLPITFQEINQFKIFYKYFTNYQYLYLIPDVDFTTVKKLKRAFNGVYLSGHIKIEEVTDMNVVLKLISKHYDHITELAIPNDRSADLDLIMEWYPKIENLTAFRLTSVERLKELKLKYLCITNNIRLDKLIPHLCDTVESLSMIDCEYTSSLFDQLNKFRRLTYIKINLNSSEFSTTLNIDTIHLIFGNYIGTILNMPNVRNIIITPYDITRIIYRIHLTSQNAITCQLTNVIKSYSELFLPNCKKINFFNDEGRNGYDADIFRCNIKN
jgi:hypothetical protein